MQVFTDVEKRDGTFELGTVFYTQTVRNKDAYTKGDKRWFICLSDINVTSVVFESKDDPTQMTKAVIYNYILYYIQKTIHSKLVCTNVHS